MTKVTFTSVNLQHVFLLFDYVIFFRHSCSTARMNVSIMYCQRHGPFTMYRLTSPEFMLCKIFRRLNHQSTGAHSDKVSFYKRGCRVIHGEFLDAYTIYRSPDEQQNWTKAQSAGKLNSGTITMMLGQTTRSERDQSRVLPVLSWRGLRGQLSTLNF
jgi:hypothetical protein